MKNVNTVFLSLVATSMVILFDRFEYTRTDDNENIGVWDMVGWYGGDTYRIYFKSEGENKQNDGEPTDIERAELLASKLIAPFWELQAGLGTRGTLTSESNMENYAVISLYGVAPYQFEMDNSLMINEDGDINTLTYLTKEEFCKELSLIRQ